MKKTVENHGFKTLKTQKYYKKKGICITGNVGSVCLAGSEGIEKLVEFANDLRQKGLFPDRSVKTISEKSGIPLKQLASNLKKLKKLELATLSASINYKRLPLFTVQTLVKTASPSLNNEFFSRMLETPFVEHVAQVSDGEATHIVTIKCPSLSELKKINEIMRGEISATGEATEGEIIDWTHSRLIFDYAWDEEYYYGNEKDEEKINPDPIDWRLLGLLKKDAFSTLRELGEELNLRPPPVLRRLRILEKEGAINGYYFRRKWENIPSELHPINVFLMVRYQGTLPKGNPMIEMLMKFKKLNPIEAHYIYGEDDFSAIIRVTSMNTLQKFAYDELSKIGRVSSIRLYPILKAKGRNVFNDFADYYEKQKH